MKTYYLAEQPRLIVVAPPEHSLALLRSISLEQLEVEVFTIEDILSHPEILNEDNVYKIIFAIESFWPEEIIVQSMTLLQQCHNNVLLYIFTSSPLETQQAQQSQLLFQYQRSQQCVIALQTYVPHTPLIVGVDVVDATFSPIVDEMLLSLEKGSLTDLGISFSPQTLHQFFTSMSGFLFKPNTPQIIAIHGKEYSTSKCVTAIQEYLNKEMGREVNILSNQGVQRAEFFSFEVAKVIQSHSDTTKVLQAIFTQAIDILGETNSVQNAQNQTIKPSEISQKNTSATAEFVKTPVMELEGASSPQTDTIVMTVPVASRMLEQPPAIDVDSATNQVAEKVLSAPSRMKSLLHRKQSITSEQLVTNEEKIRQETEKIIQKLNSATPLNVVKKPVKKMDISDVSQEIQRLFSEHRVENKVERIKKKASDQKTITRKSKQKNVLFFLGLLFIGAGLGVLSLVGVFFFSTKTLEKQLYASMVSALTHSQESPLEHFNASTYQTALFFTNIQVESYRSVLDLAFLEDAHGIVTFATELAYVHEVLSELDESQKMVILHLFGKETNDITSLAQNMALKAQEAHEKLLVLENTMQYLDTSDYTDIQQVQIAEFSQVLEKSRTKLEELQTVIPLLPELTGATTRKTYAVLFQNNQELRPTGGFIQAIALLTFENGSLISQQVYSSYASQLAVAGQVEPPEEIKELLGEKQWFVRDANWDPHFPETTQRIAWFLGKSIGVDIAGVIGIDGYMMADLLSVLGPLELPDYDEVITHRNLFERLEFHSDAILTEKANLKDYSQVLFSSFLRQLTAVNQDKVPGILQVFSNNITQQHLTISLVDAQLQNTIQSFGWTGALLTPNCPTPLKGDACTVDSYAQVEANVGVNKANHYVERKNSHSITLNEKHAHHIRRIEFSNKAQSNAWPKGTYITYLRFYLSSQAEFESISIDGIESPADKIRRFATLGRQGVGVVLEVPIQTTQVVELRYRSPLAVGKDFSYVFFDQKQSGLHNVPHSLTVSSQLPHQPSLISPQGIVKKDSIIFEHIQHSHLLFGLHYQDN